MAAPMVHASSLGECLACVVEDGNVASEVVIQLVDNQEDIVLTHQSTGRDPDGRMLFLAPDADKALQLVNRHKFQVVGGACFTFTLAESAPSARNRPGERMSLFDGSTYERPDAEVLPLITPAAARARGGWGEATPLHEAAWNSSSVAVVQALLAEYPEAASATNKNGYTPLHCAVRRQRSLAVVQALLAANPEAAMARDRGGWLPLHYAARYRSSVVTSMGVARALLAANPEAALVTDGRGVTPADGPSKSNLESKVKALIFASGQHLLARRALARAATKIQAIGARPLLARRAFQRLRRARAAIKIQAIGARPLLARRALKAAKAAADKAAADKAAVDKAAADKAAAAKAAADKAAAAKTQQEAEDAQLAAAFAASLAVSPCPTTSPALSHHLPRQRDPSLWTILQLAFSFGAVRGTVEFSGPCGGQLVTGIL